MIAEFIGWIIGQRTTISLSEIKCGWLLTMQWRPHWFGNTYQYSGTYITEDAVLEAAKKIAMWWIEEFRAA
jgi:hypothetical protein